MIYALPSCSTPDCDAGGKEEAKGEGREKDEAKGEGRREERRKKRGEKEGRKGEKEWCTEGV